MHICVRETGKMEVVRDFLLRKGSSLNYKKKINCIKKETIKVGI